MSYVSNLINFLRFNLRWNIHLSLIGFHSKFVIKQTLKSKVINFLSPKAHSAFSIAFASLILFLFSFGRLVSYRCLLCIPYRRKEKSKAEEERHNGKLRKPKSLIHPLYIKLTTKGKYIDGCKWCMPEALSS